MVEHGCKTKRFNNNHKQKRGKTIYKKTNKQEIKQQKTMSIKKVEYKDFELTKNDSSHENRILKTNDRTIKDITGKGREVRITDYREDLPELLKRHIKRLEQREEKLKNDSIKLNQEKEAYFSKYDEMIKKYKKQK